MSSLELRADVGAFSLAMETRGRLNRSVSCWRLQEAAIDKLDACGMIPPAAVAYRRTPGSQTPTLPSFQLPR